MQQGLDAGINMVGFLVVTLGNGVRPRNGNTVASGMTGICCTYDQRT